MTTTTTAPNSPSTTTDHDWHEAGEAWGHSANDWACLWEHYSLNALMAIFDRIGLRDGTKLIDIACGSGLAMSYASARGAHVAGIDAAAPLLEVAQDRNPDADLQLGSMFDLPWADDTFDAAISINGIWGGCEDALVEAFRVMRPGAMIGISFWGAEAPLDLYGPFKVFAAHSPEAHVDGMRKTNDIAFPGVAEQMMLDAGFEAVVRDVRVSTIEWPDADTAWRGLSSIGPAVPALRNSDPALLREQVLAAIEPCRDRRGIYRFRNNHQFVVGRKPLA